ncbi:excalibur calcium-binding domain-containing protein [Pseudonocardia adelaidensis]|uniref:excalibur calcium-binding domain-containing protein n=1 Tax=Pseudonocardia adelaidensis TaxID=648754 RepID=UPI0031EBF82E
MADVLGAGELLGVGNAICESIGAPGVTHAGLVAELGTPKWGTAVAEVVVAAAEADLCPQRRYAVPAAPLPQVAPAPSAPATPAAPAAPAAEPEPAPAPRPQAVVQQPAPRSEPVREEPSSAAYFKNCAAARAAGAAPLHRGDPGYRAGLDRDDDGVACE